MYIKIGISMELEEVPEKLIEILNEAEGKLSSKIDKVRSHLNQRVIEPGVVNAIESVKKELGKAEQTLQDCAEVIASYNNIVLRQKAAYLEKNAQQEQGAQEAIINDI
jgi:predicted naringenin-chalcone synthase